MNEKIGSAQLVPESPGKPIKGVTREKLQSSIKQAVNGLVAAQNSDGHWRYDMDNFVFTTAFHIITLNYIGHVIDPELRKKFGNNLRRCQLPTGGWGFVPGGSVVLSNSVIAYFALKLLGDTENEEHMVRARKAIRSNGGIEASKVQTRFNLALFGIVPWTWLPCLPVELVLLPSWFPFNIYKLAYWARVCLVPLMVLQAIKRPARNKSFVGLDELFIGKRTEIPPTARGAHQNFFVFHIFSLLDKLLKLITRYIPAGIRQRAISTAVTFCTERLNGLNGFGSVSPSMDHLLMMFDALGYEVDHPDRVVAQRAQARFVVHRGDEAYTVACLSPVWDTANAMCALLETGDEQAKMAAEKGLAWCRPRQILEVKGDWAQARPNLRPGGWVFYEDNPHYPDTDDTAVVLSAMWTFNKPEDSEGILRGTEWLLGMQSKNGGWASYDADNTHTYLNSVPAADLGSFVDPPTVDITASCVSYLAVAGYRLESFEPMRRGVNFILDNQEPNGSWWGRWGVNYTYGTRMALCSITAAGLPLDHPSVVKGTQWLVSTQNEDGGWGESVTSYIPGQDGRSESTASQTSWALLGLIAGLGKDHPSITAGIQYLLNTQNAQGLWDEEEFTGTGHPNIMYLQYQGYPKYFPLLALARYSKLRSACEIKDTITSGLITNAG